MFGATLKVKYRIADLCRVSIRVSTLILDIKDWFIDDLSIAPE